MVDMEAFKTEIREQWQTTARENGKELDAETLQIIDALTVRQYYHAKRLLVGQEGRDPKTVSWEELEALMAELKETNYKDLDRVSDIIERKARPDAAEILKKPAIVELREYMIDRARAALQPGAAEHCLNDMIQALDKLIVQQYARHDIDKDGLHDYHKELLGHTEYGFFDNLLCFTWQSEGDTASDYIECIEKVIEGKIRDVEHLQEITGINKLTGEDEKIELGTPEAKAEARRLLSETLRLAFEYRYDKALEQVLKTGGKYKDLLAIDPASFGLPVPGNSQEEGIRRAICYWASLCEDPSVRPDLQAIAENLEAPYKEVWQAAEIWNL